MRQIIIATIILFSTIANAQNHKGHFSKEEFRNRQKEFLTQKAELTAEEAEKFFPLYFEFQDKKAEYNKEVWNSMKKGDNKNATETEFEKISEDIVKTKITIDNLEMEYLKKYKKILSSKKIYKIQRAEMKFHRELIRAMKENRKSLKEKK